MTDGSTVPGDEQGGKGIDRRAIFGGAAAAAAALGGGLLGAKANAAAASMPSESDLATHLNQADHLFKLTASARKNFAGGYLQGADEETFPILRGQHGSVYFVRLEVGGFREPHWHPTAWELNFVISGSAKWTVLGTHPDGTYSNVTFVAEQGDLVFAPQGHLHYFENARTDAPLEVLVFFNSSAVEPYDDIGIVAALNAMPRDVLAAAFGVPEAVFAAIPGEIKPVVIGRRR
ncbi:cupin domain-containing protein [Nocardia sp. CDC159]|uniref:Cupin domain-containing protein n=1 Tax=Nocardia pulmonis TaxID=2951408 RepID=A0A9X2E4S2_9NOCA|nr:MULTISPECIES: cupin domain-containing protein [Nocardia]MCM6774137.1 cupin domain-containing protein [Nocardia pulmonis]MCM6787024.1 cupin domain-containing protein [Nocardia sp. CDC159]